MLKQNLENVQKRIAAACLRAGRNVQELTLVLVTKGVAPDKIREVYDLGFRNFGENRVQEWLEKKKELPANIHWHMIGHLQSNKVKFGIGEFDLIHSIDSLKLAQEIGRQAQQKNLVGNGLIQVNTSGEATKHGLSPSAVSQTVGEVKKLAGIRIRGLMTIGPLTQDEKKTREAFHSLRLLRDQMKSEQPDLDWRYLSMGMSGDFEIAIEEGANLLRIGTAIFGERKQK